MAPPPQNSHRHFLRTLVPHLPPRRPRDTFFWPPTVSSHGGSRLWGSLLACWCTRRFVIMGSTNRAAGAIAFLITIYLLAQRMTNSTSVVSAFYNLPRQIDQLFAEYKCPTKLVDLDDESYPHDNQSWPSERLCDRRPESPPISTNLHRSRPPRRHEVRCAGCKTYMSDLRAMSRNGSGYLGMAFGLGYLEMVTVQVKLLRKVGDVYPMSLLADHESLAPALGSKLFDHVILYRPECFDDGLNEVTSTAHERWNMLPELRMDLLSPYEEFMKMDTDIVPTSKGTSAIWEAFRRRGCAFDDFGVPFDSSWHWGKLGAINSKLKQKGKIETDMHHTHVGLFYANFGQGRRGSFPAILAQAKSALMRYDELGFEREFRGGAVDEILFSWALATSKHTACMPVPFGDLFAFRYDRSAPHHMVHLFDQASWRAAAVDVLGFNFRLNDTNIKAHSFGSAVVTTCSERRRAKRKEENGLR